MVETNAGDGRFGPGRVGPGNLVAVNRLVLLAAVPLFLVLALVAYLTIQFALNERAVRLDATQVAVAVNLGTYYVQRGRAREAMRLWTDALSRNPALTSVRINLAVAQYQSGDRAAAEASMLTALDYDPDQETARRLLSEIRASRVP